MKTAQFYLPTIFLSSSHSKAKQQKTKIKTSRDNLIREI